MWGRIGFDSTLCVRCNPVSGPAKGSHPPRKQLSFGHFQKWPRHPLPLPCFGHLWGCNFFQIRLNPPPPFRKCPKDLGLQLPYHFLIMLYVWSVLYYQYSFVLLGENYFSFNFYTEDSFTVYWFSLLAGRENKLVAANLITWEPQSQGDTLNKLKESTPFCFQHKFRSKQIILQLWVGSQSDLHVSHAHNKNSTL